MTKNQAYQIFQVSTQAGLARELGVTRALVCQWPNEVPQKWEQRILGRALSEGRPIPPELFAVPQVGADKTAIHRKTPHG
jgi:hypothetical protein